MCSQREPVCQTEHFPVPEGDAYFTVKLQDYTAVEKEQVVLDCELNKDVEVMWYHNEAEVKASKAVLIDPGDIGGVLIFIFFLRQTFLLCPLAVLLTSSLIIRHAISKWRVPFVD